MDLRDYADAAKLYGAQCPACGYKFLRCDIACDALREGAKFEVAHLNGTRLMSVYFRCPNTGCLERSNFEDVIPAAINLKPQEESGRVNIVEFLREKLFLAQVAERPWEFERLNY
jgi:uncharacterized OB-fold protein